MIHLPPSFKDFLKLLKEHEVAYLLIGGMQLDIMETRVLRADLDIWVAIRPQNAEKIVTALKALLSDLMFLTLSTDLFLRKDQIESMGVHTNYRGLGLGRAILSENLSRLTATGIQRWRFTRQLAFGWPGRFWFTVKITMLDKV